MLGLHEELLEVEWPDAEEGVSATSDAKSIIDRDRVDFMIIGFISCLQSLILVVDLEHHSVFAPDENSLQTFILISIGRFETVLEVEAGKYGLPGMMIEDNSRSSNVTGVSNPPESDVLLAA